MFRAPCVTLSRGLAALAGAPSRTLSTLPVPAFGEVKFKKEDVEAVMKELPEFSFYEMKESAPNPYQGTTMDRSILLDPPAATPAKPRMEFSKLENGLKVVSVDNGGLTAHLSLSVSAGSRFETSANFGVSHMVSMMGFSSTAHLSQLRTVKTLEQLGCDSTSSCTAGREDIVYKVGCLREFMPLVLPMMIGNVLFPRLLPWEVKAAHKLVAVDQAKVAGDADAMVSMLLHKAAWCNNTLGLSTLASARSMSYFYPETIRSFMLDHFAPERMVISGVNVSHAELTKWAMRSFADYNAIPLKKRDEAKALYTGGDLRMEGSSPFCHVAIGLESSPWGQKELAPIALLQTILGSGSASSGSPGTGVTSRLSTQVVRQSPYIESCAAFNTSYTDSGIFGVYGVCEPAKAGEMCAAIMKSLTGLKSVPKDELAKAKSMLKASLFRATDDDCTLLKDMSQQLLISGKYGSAADFAKIIDGVTEADVAAAAAKLLGSKPTVAAFGDTHAVPHYSAVEAGLKA